MSSDSEDKGREETLGPSSDRAPERRDRFATASETERAYSAANRLDTTYTHAYTMAACT
ncbi:MAG: hypothetical protein V3U95_00560 [Dehalococcoidia bacterium]